MTPKQPAESSFQPAPGMASVEQPAGGGTRTIAERRRDLEQALANTRISGHEPTPEYLADMEALVNGTLSEEEVRQRIVARALEADRRASGSKADQ